MPLTYSNVIANIDIELTNSPLLAMLVSNDVVRDVPQSTGHDDSVSPASHCAFPQQFCWGSSKIQPSKGSHVSFNVQALLSLQVRSVLEQMPVDGLHVSMMK